MIKVYSMNNCKYCEKAKEYLKEKNVPFEEINLSAKENREARKYYRELGIHVAPIITGLDKKNLEWIIWGFDEEKKCQLESILKDGYE
jgi:glutaredoxin 3